jgi:hypothetical protein
MDIAVTEGWPLSQIAVMACGDVRGRPFVVGISVTALSSLERDVAEKRLYARAREIKAAAGRDPEAAWRRFRLRPDNKHGGILARYYSEDDVGDL